MAILSSELSVGELTALLCAIILTLIPLTIWVLHGLESRKHDGWIRRGQQTVRSKIH
jgi:hypothetical protein